MSGGSDFQSQGGRTTESLVSNVNEAGRGNNKVSEGTSPKSAVGSGDVQQVTQVRKGEDTFERDEQYFESDFRDYGKPAELLKDQVMCSPEGGVSYDPSCRVLNDLEFMEGFVGETRKKRELQ